MLRLSGRNLKDLALAQRKAAFFGTAVLLLTIGSTVHAASLASVAITYNPGTNLFTQVDTLSDSSTTTLTGTGQNVDITSAIAANVPIALSNIHAIIILTTAATTYDAVISGTGSLEVGQSINSGAASGTGATVVTASSNASPNPIVNGATITFSALNTLALPANLLTETTSNGVVQNLNSPVLVIDPGTTVVFSATGSTSANFFKGDSTGQINLDNILNNGVLMVNGIGNGPLIGNMSGSGSLAGAAYFFHGPFSFTGVLHNGIQVFYGDVDFQLTTNASAIINEGSLLVSGTSAGIVIKQNIYESAYGNDINTDAGLLIFSGVNSNSNNTSRARPNLVNPGLINPATDGTVVTGLLGLTGNPAEFNFMLMNYTNFSSDGQTNTNATQNTALGASGNASYRGINIEGGTTQWGDGTTDTFFLPANPDNAYINLHHGATLAFDYNGANGPVILNVPVSGGAVANPFTAIGAGSVRVMNPSGGTNVVIFSQPMNYNGTTTIDTGATLQLGLGKPTLVYTQLVDYEQDHSLHYETPIVTETYSGDSSLLTALSSTGLITDTIVNNGTLIVNNTENPIVLTNVSGTGSIVQESQPNGATRTGVPDTSSPQPPLLALLPGSVRPAVPTLTLAGTNTYSGGTYVTSGSELIVGGAAALGSGGLVNRGIVVATTQTGIITVNGNYFQTISSDPGQTKQTRGRLDSRRPFGQLDKWRMPSPQPKNDSRDAALLDNARTRSSPAFSSVRSPQFAEA